MGDLLDQLHAQTAAGSGDLLDQLAAQNAPKPSIASDALKYSPVGMVKGAADTLRSLYTDAMAGEIPGKTAILSALKSNGELWQKTKDAIKSGNADPDILNKLADYGAAAFHFANYLAPGGAAIDDAGEDFAKGDYGHGLAKTAGIASSMLFGAKAPQALDWATEPGKPAAPPTGPSGGGGMGDAMGAARDVYRLLRSPNPVTKAAAAKSLYDRVTKAGEPAGPAAPPDPGAVHLDEMRRANFDADAAADLAKLRGAQYPPPSGAPPVQPSGSMGAGVQAGFGPAPATAAPVETGGAHVPDYAFQGGMTPEEFAARQAQAAPVPPGPALAMSSSGGPAAQLPAAPPAIAMPGVSPQLDSSYVRAVPAQYPETVEGWTPAAGEAAAAPPAAPAAAAAAPAEDMELLDGLSQSLYQGRSFKQLAKVPGAQDTIRRLAAMGESKPATAPAPTPAQVLFEKSKAAFDAAKTPAPGAEVTAQVPENGVLVDTPRVDARETLTPDMAAKAAEVQAETHPAPDPEPSPEEILLQKSLDAFNAKKAAQAPAREPNDFENAARARKADGIEGYFARKGLTYSDIESKTTTPTERMAFWKQAAAEAGVNPPSEMTVQLIMERLKAKESAAAAAVGEHGPIAEHLRGSGQDAVNWLLKQRTGEVPGAIVHPEIGPVDVLWGKPGDPAADFAGGYGLAHIEAKHPEVLGKLSEIIENATVKKAKPNQKINAKQKILETADHKADIRLDWHDQPKKWLLTAYRKNR
jgi:hypothetical protein